MSVTVSVNSRTVVHKLSEGMALAFPDVCLTPPGPVPVPYPNLARSEDAAGTCDSVFCDGVPVMKESSYFAQSYCDEPGVGGGLISGVNRGKVSFTTVSFDVRFEGEGAPRAFDETGHNHGSPINEWAMWLQALALEQGLEALMCTILCHCNIPFQKMACLRPILARQMIGPTLWGETCAGHWDPFIPRVWIEVPFAWNKNDKKFDPIGSPIESQFQTDEDGNPLPIPMSATAPAPGTLRPDIVVTVDPHKPPTTDNIDAIYEVKFDGDDNAKRNRAQLRSYRKLYPNAKVVVLNAEYCKCNSGPPIPPIRVEGREKVGEEDWLFRPRPQPKLWVIALLIGFQMAALGAPAAAPGGAPVPP